MDFLGGGTSPGDNSVPSSVAQEQGSATVVKKAGSSTASSLASPPSLSSSSSSTPFLSGKVSFGDRPQKGKGRNKGLATTKSLSNTPSSSHTTTNNTTTANGSISSSESTAAPGLAPKKTECSRPAVIRYTLAELKALIPPSPGHSGVPSFLMMSCKEILRTFADEEPPTSGGASTKQQKKQKDAAVEGEVAGVDGSSTAGSPRTFVSPSASHSAPSSSCTSSPSSAGEGEEEEEEGENVDEDGDYSGDGESSQATVTTTTTTTSNTFTTGNTSSSNVFRSHQHSDDDDDSDDDSGADFDVWKAGPLAGAPSPRLARCSEDEDLAVSESVADDDEEGPDDVDDEAESRRDGERSAGTQKGPSEAAAHHLDDGGQRVVADGDHPTGCQEGEAEGKAEGEVEGEEEEGLEPCAADAAAALPPSAIKYISVVTQFPRELRAIKAQVSEMSIGFFAEDCVDTVGKSGWRIDIALAGDSVIGFILYAYHKKLDFCEVKKVLVDANYRKHGIGRGLMKRVIQYAKENKFPLIGLWSYEDAEPFYRRLGFQYVNDFHEPEENGLVAQSYMELKTGKAKKKGGKKGR